MLPAPLRRGRAVSLAGSPPSFRKYLRTRLQSQLATSLSVVFLLYLSGQLGLLRRLFASHGIAHPPSTPDSRNREQRHDSSRGGFFVLRTTDPWPHQTHEQDGDVQKGATEAGGGVVRFHYVGEFGLGHRLSKMSGAYHLVRELARQQQPPQGQQQGKHSGPLLAAPEQTSTVSPSTKLRIEFHADWGRCVLDNGTVVDIFSYLFGSDPVCDWRPLFSSPSPSPSPSPSSSSKTTKPKQSVTVKIRNDVSGYYAGQMYKNAQKPVDGRLLERWYDKMLVSDLELFDGLLTKFRHQHMVREYQTQRNWHLFRVVGIHFRLGNGERSHFETSGRRMDNATQTVHNTLELVQRYLNLLDEEEEKKDDSQRKPWALFLATDTPSLVPVVRAELERRRRRRLIINGDDGDPSSENKRNATTRTRSLMERLWVSPTVARLPERGVTYTLKRSNACLQGWVDSLVDQSLLSQVDVLVAPSRSTFTQILPRAVVLDRHSSNNKSRRKQQHGSSSLTHRGDKGPVRDTGGTFCEVESVDPSSSSPPSSYQSPPMLPRMVCFRSSTDWLLRNNNSDSVTVLSLEETERQRINGGGDGEYHYLPQKLMVHLPETADDNGVDPALLQRLRSSLFLRPTNENDRDNDKDDSPSAVILRYGERFAQKYRRYPFRSHWTFGPPG